MARALVRWLVCAVILFAPLEAAAALKVASEIHCVVSKLRALWRGSLLLLMTLHLLFSAAESRPRTQKSVSNSAKTSLNSTE